MEINFIIYNIFHKVHTLQIQLHFQSFLQHLSFHVHQVFCDIYLNQNFLHLHKQFQNYQEVLHFLRYFRFLVMDFLVMEILQELLLDFHQPLYCMYYHCQLIQYFHFYLFSILLNLLQLVYLKHYYLDVHNYYLFQQIFFIECSGLTIFFKKKRYHL